MKILSVSKAFATLCDCDVQRLKTDGPFPIPWCSLSQWSRLWGRSTISTMCNMILVYLYLGTVTLSRVQNTARLWRWSTPCLEFLFIFFILEISARYVILISTLNKYCLNICLYLLQIFRYLPMYLSGCIENFIIGWKNEGINRRRTWTTHYNICARKRKKKFCCLQQPAC